MSFSCSDQARERVRGVHKCPVQHICYWVEGDRIAYPCCNKQQSGKGYEQPAIEESPYALRGPGVTSQDNSQRIVWSGCGCQPARSSGANERCVLRWKRTSTHRRSDSAQTRFDPWTPFFLRAAPGTQE